MPNNDNLIKRLRYGCLGDLRDDGSWEVDVETVNALMAEVATRIGELGCERDDYKARWEAVSDRCNAALFDLKYARQLVERLTLRAEKAEAVLAHAESDYKRMGDELLEVAHRSCERQMQLETVTAQLIIARAELAVAREPKQ